MNVLFSLRKDTRVNRVTVGSSCCWSSFQRNQQTCQSDIREDYTSPRFALNRSLLAPLASGSERGGNQVDCSRENFGDHPGHK